MADKNNPYERAYATVTQADTDALYDDWATTYDADLTDTGYLSPARCADALAGCAGALDLPVLDIGCGTGMSGVALAARGFTNLTGCDPNAKMLAQAAARGVYRDTWQTDLSDPYRFAPGTYQAIAAIGVFSAGAAPASALPQALAALAPNGLLVFSFNDPTMQRAEYTGALARVLADGLARVQFREHGPHLVKERIGSDVIVLRRT